jgi:hypothetical protein
MFASIRMQHSLQAVKTESRWAPSSSTLLLIMICPPCGQMSSPSELIRIPGEGMIKDLELQKHIVVDTLVQPRFVSYEEQVQQVCFFLVFEIVKVNSHMLGQYFEVSAC